ncbi:MAG: hypothetical protein ABSE73_20685 [Planctomycetota bacterium]
MQTNQLAAHMTPYQRRFFSLAIFAFSFIFFYEARGQRLLGGGKVEGDVLITGGYEQYWQHAAIGCFVLFLGTVLIVLFHKANKRPAPTRLELAAYALGLGVLIGTAVTSWLRCG